MQIKTFWNHHPSRHMAVSFMSGRKQFVLIHEGGISECILVPNGIPQGTVLGPVLFLIQFADTTKMLNSPKISSFADDTRLNLLLPLLLLGRPCYKSSQP